MGVCPAGEEGGVDRTHAGAAMIAAKGWWMLMQSKRRALSCTFVRTVFSESCVGKVYGPETQHGTTGVGGMYV